MSIWVMAGGLVAILAGFAIRWKLSSRAFYRRNQAGIQTFPSYAVSVFTRAWEKCASLIALALYAVGGVSILRYLFAIYR